MNTYSAYKDSGEQWLGQIPAHWEILPGMAVFEENKEKNKQGTENTVLSLSYGKIIVKEKKDEGLVPAEYTSYQIVHPNYIIIRCTDLQNDKVSFRTGLVRNDGIITSAYLGLIVKGNNPQYIHYYLHALDITKEIYRYGSGLRQSLSWSDFKRLNILVPPLDEQEAMVSYLDEQTGKIDAAIEREQKMIDLLEERKQIIIQQAVTKGLNPNAKMKDSGIEWIGEIPEGWEMRRLKYLLNGKLMYGANESPDGTDVTEPRYIRITDIDENGLLKPETYCSLSSSKAKPYLLKKGDILLARSGATVGKTFLFNEDIQACFAGYLIKASFAGKMLPQFFNYITKTGFYDEWKKFIAIQATIQNIGADKYANFVVPVPLVEEQKTIVDFISKAADPIDKAIAAKNRVITLLQERKQIIINEVVTGKIKVL
jgi:type I restriction enzyme S subunit